LSADEVLKRPHDRLADCRILGPRGLRGGEIRRSCGRCVLLLRLCSLVGDVDADSFLTVVLSVDADPDERDVDLDADLNERDAIRRGIHELPCRRDTEGTTSGGLPRTG
jgi:hypothetical protein